VGLTFGRYALSEYQTILSAKLRSRVKSEFNKTKPKRSILTQTTIHVTTDLYAKLRSRVRSELNKTTIHVTKLQLVYLRFHVGLPAQWCHLPATVKLRMTYSRGCNRLHTKISDGIAMVLNK